VPELPNVGVDGAAASAPARSSTPAGSALAAAIRSQRQPSTDRLC